MLYRIDSERGYGEHLQVSLRPPPCQLAKAIVMALPIVRLEEDDPLRSKFEREFMKIVHEWENTPGRAIL